MSKFWIRIGEFKKKLLFPIFLALTQIIILVTDKFYQEEWNNHILESTSIGLAKIAIIIIPHIKIFSISDGKKKQNVNVQKNYVFIILFY